MTGEQRSAPNHVKWMLVELVEELNERDRRPDRKPVDPAQRSAQIRARVQDVADRIWLEAFVAGGAYGQSIASAPVTLVVKPGSAMLGKRFDVEQPRGAA